MVEARSMLSSLNRPLFPEPYIVLQCLCASQSTMDVWRKKTFSCLGVWAYVLLGLARLQWVQQVGQQVGQQLQRLREQRLPFSVGDVQRRTFFLWGPPEPLALPEQGEHIPCQNPEQIV